MRIGRNPLTKEPAPHTLGGRVTACVITHLPEETGYHEGRMKVIAACFQSMEKNAGQKFDLCVWDNGSNDYAKGYIKNFVKPDIFIESHNVGKNAAMAAMFGMFPDDAIIAYSDDDILFYPDWLTKQLEVFSHFPNVACVSGYPVRTSFRWGNANTLRFLSGIGDIEAGRFISDEYERDFCDSIGRDYYAHVGNTISEVDYRVKYKGLEVYATSHHCQMIGRAATLKRAAVFDGLAMGEQQGFDIYLDRLGLRLCTTQRYTRHMGNFIDSNLAKDIKKYG